MLGDSFPNTAIEVNRPVDIDLNDRNLTDLTYDYTGSGISNLTSTGISTVENLSVKTPGASFNQGTNVTVTTLLLKDVISGTYINNGTIGTAEITDADATFENNGITSSVELDNENGNVSITGTSTIPKVIVTKAKSVTIAEGTVVSELEANDASGITVSNQGTVKITGAEAVKVSGNSKGTTEVAESSKDNVTTEDGAVVKGTATVTFSQDSSLFTMPKKLKTNSLQSLELSLADNDGNVIETNYLNEFGLWSFTSGAEKNKLHEKNGKFVRELTDNVNAWNGYIEAEAFSYEDLLIEKGEGNSEKKLEEGDLINLPAGGPVSKISTTFAHLDSSWDGLTDNRTNPRSWNGTAMKGKKEDATQVIARYKIDGVTYQVKSNND